MMENKKSYLYKKPGLTLIEVIISVALLAILSVPIFTMVNTNIKLSQKTELSQQATIVGQRILEYLGSVQEVELGNDEVLSSLNVIASFEKLPESDEILGKGTTQDGFAVEIQMKNIIQHTSETSPTLTANELMKDPLFVITELSNQLFIDNQRMNGELKLSVEGETVTICDQDSKCVSESIRDGNVTIYVQNKISTEYQISIMNQLANLVKVYVQYDANQPKNIKFVTTNGQADIIYLTKQLDISVEDDESSVTELSDLYEISILITSSKTDGSLFKGTTVSQLNIREKSMGGD